MSLPANRQISTGRTHSTSWDALRYACALEKPSQSWLWRLIFRSK